MFFYVIGGIVGGVCGGLFILSIIAFVIRSRHIWYFDGVATNWLTTPVVGPSAIVNLLFNFEDLITREKIEILWKTLFLKNHIWTNRVCKRSFLWSYMEEDPDFSLDRHIIINKEHKTMKEIKIFFQNHVNIPLETDRPLWKIYLFTNIIKDPLVENDPYVLSPEYTTRSVMILRYHHSLADGFSFLKLIFKATNFYDDIPIKSKADSTSSINSQSSVAVPPTFRSNRFGLIFTYLPSLIKLLCTPPDRENPIKIKETMTVDTPRNCEFRRMDVTLDKLKRFKKLGYSVNDILVSCLVGGVKKYCDKHGKEFDPKHLPHAYMWLSRNPIKSLLEPIPDDKMDTIYGNKTLSLLVLDMPFNDTNAWDRLDSIKHEMKKRGTSAQPICVNHGMRLIGTLPRNIGNPFFENLIRMSSMSISTLPVSSHRLTLMGATINDVVFSVPPTADVHNFITITSYNNYICVTYCADSNLFSEQDIREILEYYNDEMSELYEHGTNIMREQSIDC